MQLSDTPVKIPQPFASGASPGFIRVIPIPSQLGGAASYTDGFPPDTFTPIASGGNPPFGQDFNGLLNQISGGVRWLQAGGGLYFDTLFVSECGGYPKGAIISSTVVIGKQWVSLADNNTTNPDDPLASTNWRVAGIPTGTPTPFLTSTLPGDFCAVNGLTIGNASSNATGIAAATTLFLFVFNWLQFSNTQCPILTSAGAPSTRGANAVADFNANKQLTLPSMKGLSLMGVDTMGGASSSFLAGVPNTIGNATTPGSILGEYFHTLLTAEIPAVPFSTVSGIENQVHNHNYLLIGDSGARVSGTGNLYLGNAGVTTVTGSENQNHNHNLGGNISGGGGSHNTVHGVMTVFWGQKL